MKNRLSLFRLFTAAVLLLLLAGCGGQQDAEDQQFQNRYSAIHHPLSFGGDLACATVHEGSVYYVAVASGIPFDVIQKVDPATGESEILEGFRALQQELSQTEHRLYQPYAMVGAPDGFRMVCGLPKRNADIYDPVELWLLYLDDTGALTGSVLVEEFFGDNWEPAYLNCDGEGNAYLLETFHREDQPEVELAVYDPAGQLRGKLLADVFWKMVTLPDGRMAIQGVFSGTDQIKIVNPDKLAYEDCGVLPETGYGKLFPGGKDYDVLFSTDLSLYGCTIGKDGQPGTAEQLLSWVNCDIEGAAIAAVGVTAEGEIACMVNSAAFGPETALLQRRAEAPGETRTLTLACRGLSNEVTQSVLRFNRQDSGVRIVIRDYGTASAPGLAGGIDQMAADLASGRMADLICASNMDTQVLIDRGLLEDLWPWIESDPQLGREAVFQPLFNAAEQNGKLYEISDRFAISTTFGLKEMVGDQRGWTVAQFQEALKQLDKGRGGWGRYMGRREVVLEQMIAHCSESFIDRANWTASFDSPEFAALLEYVATFPEDITNVSYDQNYALVDRNALAFPLESLTTLKLYMLFMYEYGWGSLNWIGYPGVAGNGSTFVLLQPMAMWSGCKNKEDAWTFLRTVLLPENQYSESPWRSGGSYYGFPTNQEKFDLLVANYLRDPGAGERYSWTTDLYGNRVKMEPFTQEQMDDFLDFVNGITAVNRKDESIAAIIRDEASRYLAGDQTAEAAAKAIQSRVNLYLGERK